MRRKKPDIDRVFHALGDPTRRAILEKLSHGPISVSRPLNTAPMPPRPISSTSTFRPAVAGGGLAAPVSAGVGEADLLPVITDAAPGFEFDETSCEMIKSAPMSATTPKAT